MTFKRMVEIDVTARDRYKRSICKVRLGRTDVNREQVYAGMAWMYRQYTKDLSYEAAKIRQGLSSGACGAKPPQCRRGSIARTRNCAILRRHPSHRRHKPAEAGLYPSPLNSRLRLSTDPRPQDRYAIASASPRRSHS
ncbi:thermonuclease family protein [Pseudoduganella namucuonensis]|uniref:thermonuclease family protein n=1 Tax=Pseudoduganella namucuonensis TaxID=1035707 RepID=UPI0035307371